jgi:putative transcriptional regulator
LLAFMLGRVMFAVPALARGSQDTSYKPFLLVASPDMPDPIFQQTVILMLPSTEPPLVAGIVINKPTKMTVGQLFSHAALLKNQSQSVYFGGPVALTSPIILLRASQATDATTRLFENIYIDTDAGSIGDFLKRQKSYENTRLFLGRAQWTADQLHSEMLQGAWTISDASPDLIFSPDPTKIWRTLVQKAKLREIIYEPGDFASLSPREFPTSAISR